ncbi:MAG: response regulator [Methyloprofundus sp.]|nr:response regulator [Methyloprofundus sp.]
MSISEAAPANILIVDDEELNLEIISSSLEDYDYILSSADDGVEAWSLLQENPEKYDLIISDRMMPNMDGMELIKLIKSHPVLQHCPVIFQSAKTEHQHILEGMQAGAYFYLTKPFTEELLVSIVQTALATRMEYKRLENDLHNSQKTLNLVKNVTLAFKTLADATLTTTLISNACPDPAAVALGLSELLINAVEHGNLGISYQEKTDLNNTGMWQAEVERRLQLDEYKNKEATLTFTRTAQEIKIEIKDQGNGFDWQKYITFSPERASDNHGRGIAMASNISFERIEYNDEGNAVTIYIEGKKT